MTNSLTSGKQPDTTITAELDEYLRADAIVDAINSYTAGKKLAPIPKGYVFKKVDREAVSVANHAAFALAGGLPAYVQWAVDNPKEFYGHWNKLAQSDVSTPVGGTTIIVTSQIPVSSLDFVGIDATGKVIDTEVRAVDEIPE